jgi:hypothetical protein
MEKSPVGRAMFSIIATMAELERNIIRYGIRPATAGLHRDRILELQVAGLSWREVPNLMAKSPPMGWDDSQGREPSVCDPFQNPSYRS